MLRLPRAREVGQSWVSSVFTTFNACLSAIALVYRNRPDLLVRLGQVRLVTLSKLAYKSGFVLGNNLTAGVHKGSILKNTRHKLMRFIQTVNFKAKND